MKFTIKFLALSTFLIFTVSNVNAATINQTLSESDSKELFDVLTTWKINANNRIFATDILCVEDLESGNDLTCSLRDALHNKDRIVGDAQARPLYEILIKHLNIQCETETESCAVVADKISCEYTQESEQPYLCTIEVSPIEDRRRF